MTDRTPTITSPFLRLPFELQEEIFRYLTPDQQGLFEDHIKSNDSPDPVHIGSKGWEKTCKSLRLTCPTFSESPILNGTLFNEISIFTTPKSLQHLEAISSSPTKSALVRSAFFHPPPLKPLSLPDYRWQLESEVEWDLTKQFDSSDLLYGPSWNDIKAMLIVKRLPFTNTFKNYIGFVEARFHAQVYQRLNAMNLSGARADKVAQLLLDFYFPFADNELQRFYEAHVTHGNDSQCLTLEDFGKKLEDNIRGSLGVAEMDPASQLGNIGRIKQARFSKHSSVHQMLHYIARENAHTLRIKSRAATKLIKIFGAYKRSVRRLRSSNGYALCPNCLTYGLSRFRNRDAGLDS